MSELPPLEQPQAYVVVGPNDQRGPYTLDLLIGEVVAGRLGDVTPVWWPGLAEWTTMGAHPGVAAEIARRRGAAAPAPAQYAQPEPAQYAQPEPQYAQPEPAQYAQPESAQYAQPEPAQYAQPEPAQAAPGTFGVGQAPGTFDVPTETAAPADQWGGTTEASASVDATGAATSPAGWTVTDTSAAADAASDIVEAEVVEDAVIDSVEVIEPAAAAVGGSTVTDEHRNLFQRLVERSRHRSRAGDQVASIDTSFVEAVVSGAESQGFTSTDRTDGDTNHELRFDGGPGETLSITLGRIKGDDPEKARSSHVPVSVRFQSATYAGGLEAGVGDHGEVVIVSDEWSGQATATVSLLLTLEDYIDDRFEVDAVAVLRDVGATVSVVSGRMR